MKPTTATFAAMLLAQSVAAHYTFSILVVNGTASPHWKYNRNITYDSTPWRFPMDYLEPHATLSQADLQNTNLTCGRGAFEYAAKTETATVLAGTEVGFGTWSSKSNPIWDSGIWHQGPAQVYMSKAPTGVSLKEWPGHDAEWFKVAYWGPLNETDWFTYHKDFLYFDIPKTTPPGDYLLRIEQWMPIYANYSQWYVNCAHINVIGPGGGHPEVHGTVKFPGGYQFSDPGISLPIEVMETEGGKYNENIIRQNLTLYTPPGPALWAGE